MFQCREGQSHASDVGPCLRRCFPMRGSASQRHGTVFWHSWPCCVSTTGILPRDISQGGQKAIACSRSASRPCASIDQRLCEHDGSGGGEEPSKINASRVWSGNAPPSRGACGYCGTGKSCPTRGRFIRRAYMHMPRDSITGGSRAGSGLSGRQCGEHPPLQWRLRRVNNSTPSDV